MDVAPPRTRGMVIGVLLVLAGGAAALLGLLQLAQASISPLLLLWIGMPLVGATLAALAAYRLYGLATARYVLNRNGIGIRWGWAFEEIPLPSVRLEAPPPTAWNALRPKGSLRWPGCVVGSAVAEGYGPVEFFATRAGAGMLLVVSASRTLAISPPDRDAFQRAFVEASRQGVLDPVEPRSTRPDLFLARLWRDGLARALLILSLGLPLMLLGFLGLRAGSLPRLVPFGFDSLGNPDPLVPPGRLLLLPLIGGLCWVIDFALGSTFYRKPADRPLAYGLWGVAVVVGLLLWGATLSLLAAA
ncbi:MAG TPA: PH domain-containing protein [Anaerolineales bacterium]|nr:PH domain-containing protein [Anaerolineales bacterium]